MRRWITIVALVLAGGSASAEQGQARFTVAVTVPVRVTLEVIEQPAALTLTADDVARGYKDVSARYVVRHNDRNGYLLQIAARPGPAQRVEVHGLGADVVLRDDVVDIHRSGEAFLQDLALQFRFVLTQSVRPGTFELPVNVAAVPL
jgi:hypothetical protein